MQYPLNMVTAVVKFQKSETPYGIGHVILVYLYPDNSSFLVKLRLNFHSRSEGIVHKTSSEKWVLHQNLEIKSFEVKVLNSLPSYYELLSSLQVKWPF